MLTFFLLLAASCGAGDEIGIDDLDPPPDDTERFASELAPKEADGKADDASATLLWTLANTLHNGEKVSIAYRNPPLHRAITIQSIAGATIELRVRSTSGDPVACLLDPRQGFKVLFCNDNASAATTDARILVRAPSTGVYYATVRDRLKRAVTLDLTLVRGGVASRALTAGEKLYADHFDPPPSLSSESVQASSSAYTCLSAASAFRRAQEGAGFSLAYRGKLLLTLYSAADGLVTMSSAAWDGKGWGLPKAWDAFQNGTTNPASTVYAFQTGLAIWCLAEATDLLRVPTYRKLATSVFHAYRGVAYVAADSLCAGCGYFYYDNHANDAGRYVKNTNIEMAMAGLALGRYFGDTSAQSIGAAAAKAHYTEIAKHKNYNYLGVKDAGYNANASKWDAHNSFESYILLRAGEALGQADYIAAAKTHYLDYVPHEPRPKYRAYAACHFASYLPEAEKACRTWIEENKTAAGPAGIGLVMKYR